MKDRDLSYAQEHHQRLIEAARIQRLIKSSPPSRPSWSDFLLLRLGDSLIGAGQKMKDWSSTTQAADLSQECA